MDLLSESIFSGSDATSSRDRLDALLRFAELVGMDHESLYLSLIAVSAERITMWLVGVIDESLNYDERCEVVRQRLRRIAIEGLSHEQSDRLVRFVVETQARVALASGDRKAGIGSISEVMADGLLEKQGHRCAVCGVPLRSRVRQKSSRFSDGVEPIGREHLDHVLPFYWAGNELNLRVLCSQCNQLKNDRLGMQEDGFVLSGNHVRRRDQSEIRRRVAFWTLARRNACEIVGCQHTATSSLLYVGVRDFRSPWLADNLEIRCDEHSTVKHVWLHAETRPVV